MAKTNVLFIILALILMAFVSADATSRPKSHIEVVYQPQANGDYRLFIFGSDRTLVCEEKPIQIIQQGDAVNPVIIECKH